MRHRDFSLAVKAEDVTETGRFAGYASVFNIIDQGGDVVQRGAFEKTLAEAKRKDRLIPMLWQHNRSEPIGGWDVMREDEIGLYVEGKLHIEFDAVAQRAHGHLKARTVGGLSIGYNLVPDGFQMHPDHEGVFELIELDLRETSIVTMPMLLEARVTDVKSIIEAGVLPSPRQFESFLRDAGGFSRERAKAMASLCAPMLGARDAGGKGEVETGGDLAWLKSLADAAANAKDNHHA